MSFFSSASNARRDTYIEVDDLQESSVSCSSQARGPGGIVTSSLPLVFPSKASLQGVLAFLGFGLQQSSITPDFHAALHFIVIRV